ncbi:WhiB family transcriptional regulator [Brevibacterium sp. 50QC2O2]|uniref:WhiB family transcriptional regulator n=1 Tax=Brevibacterium TaxID=1696 RepID=UPI003592F083
MSTEDNVQRNHELDYDLLGSITGPTVEDRIAGDWSADPVTEPARRSDPLQIDPVELVPLQAGPDASVVSVPNPLQRLLSEELRGPGWQELALCAQTDPEAFFPEKGGSTREAKKVCGSCEVRMECLEFALENDERFGIWGGLSERERRALKKQGGIDSLR